MHRYGEGINKTFAKALFDKLYNVAEQYGFNIKSFRIEKENDGFKIYCFKTGKVPNLKFIFAYDMMFFQGEIKEKDNMRFEITLK